jgi:hypothetical protein
LEMDYRSTVCADRWHVGGAVDRIGFESDICVEEDFGPMCLADGFREWDLSLLLF